MKAILIDSFVSTPTHLKLQETPPPIPPSPHHITIKITHAAITHVDLLYALGHHQNNKRHIKPPFPLGTEYAGIVVTSAPTHPHPHPHSSSTFLRPGTRVFGTALGSFAEQICVDGRDRDMLRVVPAAWSNAQACAVGLSGAVSYGALVLVAGLKQGETVLVFGASGGLGVMAVQVAKAVGARVIAVVGDDEEKGRVVRAVGADEVVGYKEVGWEGRVKGLTERGEGVHVVFDAIGAVESGLKCLRYRGRIVVVGFAARGGHVEKVRANRILLKSATVHGYRFGEDGRRDPRRIQDAWNGFMNLVEAGRIEPVIYKEEYNGLEAVPRALDDLSRHQVWGRAILKINDEDGQRARL